MPLRELGNPNNISVWDYEPLTQPVDPSALATIQEASRPKWQNALLNAAQSIGSALTAPGNALMGKYAPILNPAAPGGVDPYSSMIPDVANLAGMVTLGAGAVPAEAGALRAGVTYHRFTKRPNPDNGAGYMMFKANDPEQVRHYGTYHHTYDGSGAVPISRVISAARKAGFEDAIGYSPEELDPPAIVDSAGAWDDPGAVQWLWDNVLDKKGWHAVRTSDGAIVLNPDLVKTLGPEDHFGDPIPGMAGSAPLPQNPLLQFGK